MALAAQLGTMRSAVRQRANIENQTGFISDAEINAYLNYSCNDLYDRIIVARGQDYYRTQTTFITTSGVDTYALPANFYQLISVDISLGGPTTITARPYMEPERNRFKWYPGWFYNKPIYYRLLGSNVRFIPVPSGQFTVTLNYVPAYVPLVLDSDSFDGVSGWEEWAIWNAVEYCLDKGQEDSNFASKRKAEIQARIDGLVADRDAGMPERVHDVYADEDGWGWYSMG